MARARAPLFMRHKGVKVYHVFCIDDLNVGIPEQYAYSFDPIDGCHVPADGVVTFDVRDLSTFDKGGPHDETAIKAAIRAALDKGEVGPKRTVACSLCGRPCAAMRAHHYRGKWVGDECCWDDGMRASEFTIKRREDR
jgi:hypothetical protein